MCAQLDQGLFLFFGFGLESPSIARHMAGTDGHLTLPPDNDNPLAVCAYWQQQSV
jgi:hypothetical protein